MGKFLLSTLLLLTTAFASIAAEKTITISDLGNTITYNGNPGKISYSDAATGIKIDGWASKNVGLQLNKSVSGFMVTGNSNNYTIKTIKLKMKSGGKTGFTIQVYKNSTLYSAPTSAISSMTGIKVKEETIKSQTDSYYTYEINDIAFGLRNSASNNAAVISEIEITYENSGEEPSAPTECAAPVFTIDGKNIESGAGNAYAGSIISVSCPTSGSTVSWAVTVNNGEQTTIEGDAPTYIIPESAQIGDVYAFTATASVEGEIDGIAQTLTKSSTLEVTIAEKKGTRTNPYSVADIIAGNNNLGNGIWVKGFIVGSMVNNNVATTGHVNTNLVLSANIDDHTNIVPVELPSGQVRTGLNIKDHSEYINEEVLIYGNSKAYFGKTGIKGTSAYKLLHIAPAVPQLDESVTVSENNTISGTGTVIVKFTGLDEFTNIYYTLEPKSKTPGVEAYSAEGHNHSELLYDKENGIPLNSTHVGYTLKAFVCDSETGLDSTPVEYAIDITTGVAEIEAAGAGEVRWFDMQGREVKGQPEKGIYVRVVNGKASKVIL